MKGIIYHHFGGNIRVENLPDPLVANDSVIIKVKATGLCLSDWHGWMGHDKDIVLPHVPGHEWAGEVVETGKNIKKFRVGDRVTAPFVGGCGACGECDSGNHQVCDHQFQPGFTHWGSFAEYVKIDYADTNLVKLPGDMKFTEAAVLGCRFITAYRAIADQGKLAPGQTIAVHGCGGVGLSAIQIAHALGAEVVAIDINESALNLAKKLGADHCLNGKEITDIPQAVRELTHGGVHVSIDALGHSITAVNSIEGLRKRGKHIQVGLMTGSHARLPVPMDKILSNELEIIGSHGMQAFKYPDVFDLIQSGKINLSEMVNREIDLEQACELLPDMHHQKTPGINVIRFPC